MFRERSFVVPSPSSPSAFRPQHRTLPDAIREQVWNAPAAMAWTPVSTSLVGGVGRDLVVP